MLTLRHQPQEGPARGDVCGSVVMGTYVYRLFGAAVLDGGTYENLEADRSVTMQAVVTVLLASVAGGFGMASTRTVTAQTVFLFSVIALAGWLAWAVLLFHIGTRVLPGSQTRTDLGELLRTTGFAAAPGFLAVFAVFPRVTAPVFIVTAVWMVAAMVVAVRHALDFKSTGRALAVCLVALCLCAVVTFFLAASFSTTVG